MTKTRTRPRFQMKDWLHFAAGVAASVFLGFTAVERHDPTLWLGFGIAVAFTLMAIGRVEVEEVER